MERVMLTEKDKTWLSDKFPDLKVSADGVFGSIGFTATYNKEIGKFLRIGDDTNDTVGGIRLSGNFTIRIRQRTDLSNSSLPILEVGEVDPIPDRHFSQTDKGACLCSPLEEDRFLLPRFEFEQYMEKLVVPFLYGQLFFNLEGRWPWSEYAHGAVGLLESYSKNPTHSKAKECLHKLSRDLKAWREIKPILLRRSYVKGHTSCFCIKADPMRRCHSDALEGIRLLQETINKYGIPLP